MILAPKQILAFKQYSWFHKWCLLLKVILAPQKPLLLLEIILAGYWKWFWLLKMMLIPELNSGAQDWFVRILGVHKNYSLKI